MVVSTLQYEYDILENLRSTVNNANLFVEVQPLGLELSKEIIKDWLEGKRLVCGHGYIFDLFSLELSY